MHGSRFNCSANCLRQSLSSPTTSYSGSLSFQETRKPLARRLRCLVQAASDPDSSTRLVRAVRSVPVRVSNYFRGRSDRQILWCFISYGSGFYIGNSISLSFGALAVNDIIAAATMVAFYEYVSYSYFTAEKVSLKLLFLNWIKLGMASAFIVDALKLGG